MNKEILGRLEKEIESINGTIEDIAKLRAKQLEEYDLDTILHKRHKFIKKMVKYFPKFTKKHLRMFVNIGCRFDKYKKMDYWRIYYKNEQILYLSESKFKKMLELFEIIDEILPKFLCREKYFSLTKERQDLKKILKEIQS
jgi:hypothetical protein